MMSVEDVRSMLSDDDQTEQGSSGSPSAEVVPAEAGADGGFSVQSGSIMFEPAPDPDDTSTAAEMPSVRSDGSPDLEVSVRPKSGPESSSAQTQYDMPILYRDIGTSQPTVADGHEPADSVAGTHLGVPVPQEIADAVREQAQAEQSDARGPEALEAVMQAPTRQLDLDTLRRDRAMSAPTKQVDLEALRKERSGDRHQRPTKPSYSPLEMPALKLDPEDKRAGPDPDDVPTRFEMPALTMEDIEKLRKAAEDNSETLEGEDGPDAIATTPETDGIPEDAAEKGEFSETQWFMKGAVVDADLLESVEPSEYDHDDKIRTGERKNFTLRDLEEDE